MKVLQFSLESVSKIQILFNTLQEKGYTEVGYDYFPTEVAYLRNNLCLESRSTQFIQNLEPIYCSFCIDQEPFDVDSKMYAAERGIHCLYAAVCLSIVSRPSIN